MAAKNKFYVIWNGEAPGIYTSWAACQKQIKGIKGAQYMGFPDRDAAEAALRGSYQEAIKKKKSGKKLKPEQLERLGKPNYNSIAVDAAVSGNPGKLEYRGVDTKTGKVLFKQGPFDEGSNNLGEFLALVHGLAFLKERKSNRVLYTDSRTAMSWVRKKTIKTSIARSEKNQELFALVDRAISWLKSNSYQTPIVKWETKAWGEIPADYGRK